MSIIRVLIRIGVQGGLAQSKARTGGMLPKEILENRVSLLPFSAFMARKC